MTIDNQKILDLLDLVDGSRDKAFLFAAFPEATEAELNEALVSLGLAGKIDICADGISIIKDNSLTENSSMNQIGNHDHINSMSSSQEDADLWLTSIESLNLREPVVRNLNHNHIYSIRELIQCSEADLLALRGMGIKKVNEVIEALEEVDLVLGQRLDLAMSDKAIQAISSWKTIDTNEVAQEPVSLDEWLSSLKDNHKHVMEMRFSGYKLQQVGDDLGISRERVRQIESKSLKKRPVLIEDEYRYLYDTYDIPKKSFCVITNESLKVYYYLKLTSDKKKEKKQIGQLLGDDKIPDSIKDALRNGNADPNAIYVNGDRVSRNKHDIAVFLLRSKFSSGPIQLSQLYDAYKVFLKENSLEDDKRLDPTNRRAFYTLLERNSEMIITPSEEAGEGGAVRIFDRSVDFTSLQEAVAKMVSRNAEYAAGKLLENDSISKIAKSLDIRNGNELHVVLNRYCDPIVGVTFGRMPMITLGEADRDEQVLELIKEKSPANAQELGIAYEKRYGVTSATFCGTYLKNFSTYYHDGRYVYEPAVLTQDQTAFIKGELDRNSGYMSLAKMRERFASQYPDTPIMYLNSETITRAGGRISGNLVIRNGLDVSTVFQKLIDENEYINEDTPGVEKGVLKNQEFLSELNKALRRFEVVEYDDDSYLSTRILSESSYPVHKEDMRDFLESAVAFMKPGIPYTINFLRNVGFDHKLFELSNHFPVKDRFYESILSQGYSGVILKRSSCEGTMFFCKKDGWFTFADVLEYVISAQGSMTISALKNYLLQTYGLKIERPNLILALNRTDLQRNQDTDLVSKRS